MKTLSQLQSRKYGSYQEKYKKHCYATREILRLFVSYIYAPSPPKIKNDVLEQKKLWERLKRWLEIWDDCRTRNDQVSSYSSVQRQVKEAYERGFWNHKKHGKKRCDSEQAILIQYRDWRLQRTSAGPKFKVKKKKKHKGLLYESHNWAVDLVAAAY